MMTVFAEFPCFVFASATDLDTAVDAFCNVLFVEASGVGDLQVWFVAHALDVYALPLSYFDPCGNQGHY